jgi:dolichol-phosphate mannosyltransferase
MKKKMSVSVVIPAYNEDGNILELTNRVAKVLCDYPHEILFVDDGSTDRTLELIKRMQRIYHSIRFLSFSRNFGHQNALKAGLDHATGKCVITMDADLQHPPELIPELIQRWREGYKIVYTIRKDSCSSPVFKRVSARWFYALLNLISEVHIQEGTADFRLLDRTVVDILKQLKESAPFYRGIIPWTGFSQTGVHYTAAKRYSGYSKYSLLRMTQFALGGLVSFSVMPLRLATVMGIIMAASGFIIGIKAVYEALFTARTVPGWASTIVSVVFVGGVQLLILGIIGEYLGHLFIESKRRPHYILRESSLAEEVKK